MEESELPQGISRRKVIKRAGIGAAVVWAAPALTSLSAPAFAGTDNPNPECASASCGSFTPCSGNNPACVCTAIFGGGGYCIDGNTSCGAGSGACGPNGECQAGEFCLVDTCCGGPVCIPNNLGCAQGGQADGEYIPNGRAGTIGG